MKAYKGFNEDMTCRDFQYEEGKEYEFSGDIKCCKKGFHACEYPLDVFSYYEPSKSVFREVELNDDNLSKADDGDSKVCAKHIKIGAKLDIAGLVKAAIDFTMSKIDKAISNTNNKDYGASSNTGYKGVSSNTGNWGASSNTGYKGASSNTGDYGASSNTGFKGASSNTGDYGASSNTGNWGASSNTGNCGASSNTGYKGASSNTGDYGASSNTGDWGASSNTGDCGASSNTGYKGASSNTGDYGASSNTGNCGASSNTGYKGASSTEDAESIAVAWGYKSKAKGCLGAYIVLTEWEYDGKKDADYEGFDYRNDKEHWHLKEAKMFKVDGKEIKPDTFYELINGKPTKVESEGAKND